MFSPDKQPLVNWPVEGGGQSSASKCAPHRQSGGSERDAPRAGGKLAENGVANAKQRFRRLFLCSESWQVEAKIIRISDAVTSVEGSRNAGNPAGAEDARPWTYFSNLPAPSLERTVRNEPLKAIRQTHLWPHPITQPSPCSTSSSSFRPRS
uniref:HDC15105 n=1 Tax=Drosophila melanogaster TaxID=7227 RepID=Q6IJD5_DROME|nr:TPA_inf: HDC15105 [Drosophila melanogaster]